jgi:hypothetical protein
VSGASAPERIREEDFNHESGHERHGEAVQGAAGGRFWLKAGSATLAGFFFVLTLVGRDWIEALLRVNPDGHSGAVEWLIALGFLVFSVMFARLARSEFRHMRAHPGFADLAGPTAGRKPGP